MEASLYGRKNYFWKTKNALPLLLQGYKEKFEWLTTRKYFEDFPF